MGLGHNDPWVDSHTTLTGRVKCNITAKVYVIITFSLFGSPLKNLKSDWNQTWAKDEIEVPLYANEVKGHVLRSRSS